MSALIWDEVAELALARIKACGAEYGDIRLLDSTTQTIRGEDRRIASIREMQDGGFGIRVLYHGAWGFAASSVRSMEEASRVAELAIEIAVFRTAGFDAGEGEFGDFIPNKSAHRMTACVRNGRWRNRREYSRITEEIAEEVEAPDAD